MQREHTITVNNLPEQADDLWWYVTFSLVVNNGAIS